MANDCEYFSMNVTKRRRNSKCGIHVDNLPTVDLTLKFVQTSPLNFIFF
eukprot:gene9321-1408_t